MTETLVKRYEDMSTSELNIAIAKRMGYSVLPSEDDDDTFDLVNRYGRTIANDETVEEAWKCLLEDYANSLLDAFALIKPFRFRIEYDPDNGASVTLGDITHPPRS
jgi:hypothetical protein